MNAIADDKLALETTKQKMIGYYILLDKYF